MTTYQSSQRSLLGQSAKLPAPSVAAAKAGVINPAWRKVVITLKAYPLMACGDEVLLCWHGLNSDAEPYRHEVRGFVTERHIGRNVVFVVREPHIAELDGGSLEISYQVTGRQLPTTWGSEPLHLEIGDASPQLLAAVAADAVGGALDPGRVPEGTRVTIRPYARMAVGDRVILIASRGDQPLWRDVLEIEAHAVGREVSFWLDPSQFAAHVGHDLALTYVVRRGHSVRRAEALALHIGPLLRPALELPRIQALQDGWLDIDDYPSGVTVTLYGAGLEAGELVWLQCNGRYAHVEEREITRVTAGQPVTFIVPAAFWQDQRGRSVQLFYQVERLDDVSQRSAELTVQVHAGDQGEH
ncbi:hypothetical protein [Pseudomonas citrulli]|uniref:Uncharacterized protein n=1 Tax=Pseudomonas citrulli TaxID=3064347 RepID=A0ABT9BUX6_9PSED|nr:hypothetical protein [Pseudomonas sp. K18]MDO7896359.1 hypothetical protein [Pseudomonas sp. K18]